MRNFFVPIYLIVVFSLLNTRCNDNNGQPLIRVKPEKSELLLSAQKDQPPIDTPAYNQKLIAVTNGDTSGLWPVKSNYPLPGAIFPFKRIIAYYGNLYSKQMGILGELPEDSMLSRLNSELKNWQKADTSTTVIPALHYIAVTAQASPGQAGKYRLRMPFNQIDKVLTMAKKIEGLVFIDIQVGLGTLQEELPQLEKYLSMPQVHLGIDPEFSMKSGAKPGTEIGNFDAKDINYAQEFLADLVRKNNLPPKVLVIHRFTQRMVTGYKRIKSLPEVQIVMNMDGWGSPAKKINTYRQFIYAEPVQFTGFKIFYKNDTKKVGLAHVMQPSEVLKLKPHPVYIQYQ